jgi:hypothetical protein
VMQQTNARQVGAGQAGQHRIRPGRDHEPVVRQFFGVGVPRLGQ